VRNSSERINRFGGQQHERRTPFEPQTSVAIKGQRWSVNGEVTYRNTRAERLLLNVRMVESVFEDRHQPDFDPDADTNRFLSRLAD
jgi:hypothetical protein